jgi:hypothetical protein
VRGTGDYDHNVLGQPTQVSIPNGMTTAYGYDRRNREEIWEGNLAGNLGKSGGKSGGGKTGDASRSSCDQLARIGEIWGRFPDFLRSTGPHMCYNALLKYGHLWGQVIRPNAITL